MQARWLSPGLHCALANKERGDHERRIERGERAVLRLEQRLVAASDKDLADLGLDENLKLDLASEQSYRLVCRSSPSRASLYKPWRATLPSGADY